MSAAATRARVALAMDVLRVLMRHGGQRYRATLRADVATSGGGLNAALDGLMAAGFVEQVHGPTIGPDALYAVTPDARTAWGYAPARIRAALTDYYDGAR